jgi:hypothetical protein
MLGKSAFSDNHLALAASLPAGADRFDLDSHRASRVQQIHARRNLSLPARGLENHTILR